MLEIGHSMADDLLSWKDLISSREGEGMLELGSWLWGEGKMPRHDKATCMMQVK